jgi:putative AdoMet-dependent methyltransferase
MIGDLPLEQQFYPEEFDRWAAGYDQDVLNENVFPFIGYRQLMAKLVSEGSPLRGKKVLDLGCGTGNLVSFMIQEGAEAWSTDFSSEMIKIAKMKFPDLPFEVQDLRDPLPAIYPQRYDLITSAYVFHHFLLSEKIRLVKRYLNQHLNSGGKLLIGDLVFQDQSAMQQTSQAYPDTWDDEYYWILEEDLPILEASGLKVQVFPISVCAAVLVFQQ